MHFFLLTFLGVCQANDIDGTDASIIPGWHKHNNTMEHHAKKPPTAQGHQPHAVKGECPVKTVINLYQVQVATQEVVSEVCFM